LTYDGQSSIFRPAFTRATSVTSVIETKYREMLASGLMFNGISLYNLLVSNKPNDPKFEARGIKKVKGQDAYVVELKQGQGLLRLYFDVKDFMWIRTDFGTVTMQKQMGAFSNDAVPHAEDDTTVDFYFETSDFRPVEGVKLPFKFVQVVTMPILKQKTAGTITGTITEYKHNIDIDPKMFK
jgi:hypothetical protein